MLFHWFCTQRYLCDLFVFSMKVIEKISPQRSQSSRRVGCSLLLISYYKSVLLGFVFFMESILWLFIIVILKTNHIPLRKENPNPSPLCDLCALCGEKNSNPMNSTTLMHREKYLHTTPEATQ